MSETPGDVLLRYGVLVTSGSTNVRNMPEARARMFAYEMTTVAAECNRVGENHVAITALCHAVIALATAQPPAPVDHQDREGEYEKRWQALADALRKDRAVHKKAALERAEQQDYYYASANQISAKVLRSVLLAMGEPVE